MHVHTVMVKLHNPATVDQCRALMESMNGRIDYMIDLRVEVNNLVGSYSCDLSLTTVWPDLAAYERYTADPVHLEVREQVLDLMANGMTIDYSTESAAGEAGVR